MALQLHNPRPRPDTVTYLAVPFVDDMVNSVISIGVAAADFMAVGGGLALLAVPTPVAVSAAMATASLSLGHTYHKRGQASLAIGRIEVRTKQSP